MKKIELVNKLSRTFHRAGLHVKKHSPEILVGAGIVSGIAATVFACKATLKVNEVLDEAKTTINSIHDVAADVEAGVLPAEKYTPEDAKKDLTIVYAQTGLKLVKLYAPAIIFGAAAVTCVLSGHNIMKKRNAALATAYAAIDSSFKAYRGRVVDRFGETIDKELKYGVKAQEVEETVVDEKGKETTVTKKVKTFDPNNLSPFAIVFDESHSGWNRNADLTKYFLMQQQNFLNDKLKAQGHLFLNELHDAIGHQHTSLGAVVGWIYDEHDPDRDCYVDFGLFNLENPKAVDFVNGYEKSFIIDPNVDGVIYDLIG